MKTARKAFSLAIAVFASLPPGVGARHQSAGPSADPPDAERVRTEIHAIERALPRIPDRGAALFLLARRYAHLGDHQRALELLKECLARDEGFDPADVPDFKSLSANADFRRLVDEVHRHRPPVHRATVAFTVHEADLFPEGLAFDPAKRVFYMGSMYRRKIVVIAESGAVSDFVKSNLYNLSPVGGIKVDPADGSVWAASDSAEFVHFDAHGSLIDRFTTTDPGDHILNDLVLRGNKEIYLTDTRASQVYRFDREAHTFTPLTFHRPVFYPNGITISPDGNVLYVADIFGVIASDLRTQIAEDVDRGPANTLAGIDGLYWYENSLVAVQYGTGAFRVIRCMLSPNGRRVTSTEIFEQRSPLLTFPTTGAIVGDRFFFIANTGIGNLDEGKIVDPRRLEPIHIGVVRLSGKAVNHPAR